MHCYSVAMANNEDGAGPRELAEYLRRHLNDSDQIDVPRIGRVGDFNVEPIAGRVAIGIGWMAAGFLMIDQVTGRSFKIEISEAMTEG